MCRPGVIEVALVSIVPVTLSTFALKVPSLADMAMGVAPASQGAVSMYMRADAMFCEDSIPFRVPYFVSSIVAVKVILSPSLTVLNAPKLRLSASGPAGYESESGTIKYLSVSHALVQSHT